LHFLAAGLVLFITGHVLNPEGGERDQLSRIELTENDLRQLAVVWTAQWGRPPTPEELRNLVEGRVREEVLYREALALGLERGDTIVKRRLAQKIQFLAEDVSGLRDPADEELRAWFSRNGARFTSSDRVSFRQLYFSFDQRGERARGAAGRALETLAASPNRSVARAVRGDPFIFEDYYGDQASEDVARVFGTGFAEAVFRLRPGAWQGPIESGFGWHVVWVDAITRGRIPTYEEIEPAVRAAWLDEQRDESRRRAFDAMRARYQVVLPSAGTKAAATGAHAAEKSP
jgi:hypothetical protein